MANLEKQITVNEYSYIVSEKAPEYVKGNKISHQAFNELTELIQKKPLDIDIDHGSIFWQRGQQLQVRHYVGIIQTTDGTQIEILPKMAKSFDVVKLRDIVLKMLREVGDLPHKSGHNASLDTAEHPLLELFIHDFLNEVQHLVKQGIRSDYLRQSDNLSFLKGKLLTVNQLKYNLIRRDRFFVEYDNFDPNRPENRLIKSSLNIVLKLCKNFRNQRIARELLFTFADIPESSHYNQDFQSCSQDRGMYYYQKSLAWCRLILNNQSPIPQIGEQNFHSLLFPMPFLFEKYVANIFKQQLNGWLVKSQVNDKKLLSSKDKNQELFQIRPDLLLINTDKKIIVDTKWKLIDSNDKKNKYSISQSDLYQVFAYAKYFDSNHVILIYPKTDSFQTHISFDYIDQNCKLDLWPLDLDEVDEGMSEFSNLINQ